MSSNSTSAIVRVHNIYATEDGKSARETGSGVIKTSSGRCKERARRLRIGCRTSKKTSGKRAPARLTEEGDLRADLTFVGVLWQLFDKKPPKPQELMKAFAPHIHATLLEALKEGDEKRVKNIERNWRKLLNETQVLPKKKHGRPRKGTD